MQIQWYPGHMEKARRSMSEKLKNIDLVIELVDARLPFSSRNPLLMKMANGKLHMIIMTKKDRADSKISEEWLNFFRTKEEALLMDVLTDDVRGTVLPAIKRVLAPKIERARRRGIHNKALRVMVVGIPNVGKSTFINRLTGRNGLKAENRPGVTRALVQLRLDDGIELVDTPGVLWPKFEDAAVGIKLALAGSINDQILDSVELAQQGLAFLLEEYPGLLATRYAIEEGSLAETFERIGRSRGQLKAGNRVDYLKTAEMFLNELRNSDKFTVSYEKVPGE